MAYTVAWDEASPAGTVAANTLDTELQNLKVSIRERIEDVITPWSTDATDPKSLAVGVLSAGDVTTPSLAARSDSDSGFYFEGADVVSVAIGGVKKYEFGAAFKADTIAELTAAAGVTIDGVLLKDSLVGSTYGGTGRSNPTSGNLLVGAGASAMTELAPGVAGGYVRSNGTTWTRSSGVAAADVQAGTFAAGAFTFQSSVTATEFLESSRAHTKKDIREWTDDPESLIDSLNIVEFRRLDEHGPYRHIGILADYTDPRVTGAQRESWDLGNTLAVVVKDLQRVHKRLAQLEAA